LTCGALHLPLFAAVTVGVVTGVVTGWVTGVGTLGTGGDGVGGGVG
jgi:hypothetical protein